MTPNQSQACAPLGLQLSQRRSKCCLHVKTFSQNSHCLTCVALAGWQVTEEFGRKEEIDSTQARPKECGAGKADAAHLPFFPTHQAQFQGGQGVEALISWKERKGQYHTF